MKQIYISHIAQTLQLKDWQVENCAIMFADGDTIPFISRYRKEKTGGMDDATVAEVKHLVDVFEEMEKRKATILKTIEDVGALTEGLRARIESCTDASELEDLYLPWRPKRRTKATAARELGLEPLADLMWKVRTSDPRKDASRFVSGSPSLGKAPGASDVDAALQGARDIIAERLSETAPIRESLRNQLRRSRFTCKVTKSGQSEPEAAKYRNYFDFSTGIAGISAHSLLAALRAENEGYLRIALDTDESRAEGTIMHHFYKNNGHPSPALDSQIKEAAEDSYKRLLEPSISGEVLREAKAKADVESIKVFGENLRQLLLEAPVGQKRTMAIDPGFRNGCKIACLGSNGELLCHTIIYPHPPQNEKIKAIMTVQDLIEKHDIQAIAVGNGTASRETMEFLKRIDLPDGCKVWSVSEDGASIYSASEAAREEFPDKDVTVRGAVSIGRRLMDPLSELVKIDPKNLGVGQYQHDVDQALLKEKLQTTVESCVNSVGVNVNTASTYLLSYVAGIGPVLAQNIVKARTSCGGFRSRSDLLKVPRLGPKAFEQCAGFLRIRGGSNPLDASAVHPESYGIVDSMAASLGVTPSELVGNQKLCESIKAEDFVSGNAGLPTIKDIIRELAKPGLDPRESASEFEFADDIHSLEDLKTGMVLPGIVTNITNFGAFIDIGLHENGLLHVSQLGPRGTDVSRVLKLHQKISVKVLDVDLERQRIALTLNK